MASLDTLDISDLVGVPETRESPPTKKQKKESKPKPAKKHVVSDDEASDAELDEEPDAEEVEENAGAEDREPPDTSDILAFVEACRRPSTTAVALNELLEVIERNPEEETMEKVVLLADDSEQELEALDSPLFFADIADYLRANSVPHPEDLDWTALTLIEFLEDHDRTALVGNARAEENIEEDDAEEDGAQADDGKQYGRIVNGIRRYTQQELQEMNWDQRYYRGVLTNEEYDELNSGSEWLQEATEYANNLLKISDTLEELGQSAVDKNGLVAMTPKFARIVRYSWKERKNMTFQQRFDNGVLTIKEVADMFRNPSRAKETKQYNINLLRIKRLLDAESQRKGREEPNEVDLHGEKRIAMTRGFKSLKWLKPDTDERKAQEIIELDETAEQDWEDAKVDEEVPDEADVAFIADEEEELPRSKKHRKEKRVKKEKKKPRVNLDVPLDNIEVQVAQHYGVKTAPYESRRDLVNDVIDRLSLLEPSKLVVLGALAKFPLALLRQLEDDGLFVNSLPELEYVADSFSETAPGPKVEPAPAPPAPKPVPAPVQPQKPAAVQKPEPVPQAPAQKPTGKHPKASKPSPHYAKKADFDPWTTGFFARVLDLSQVSSGYGAILDAAYVAGFANLVRSIPGIWNVVQELKAKHAGADGKYVQSPSVGLAVSKFRSTLLSEVDEAFLGWPGKKETKRLLASNLVNGAGTDSLPSVAEVIRIPNLGNGADAAAKAAYAQYEKMLKDVDTVKYSTALLLLAQNLLGPENLYTPEWDAKLGGFAKTIRAANGNKLPMGLGMMDNKVSNSILGNSKDWTISATDLQKRLKSLQAL
jgi:hypothetical protein